ncbi:MAG: DUF4162 domain-containing protein [Kiritimatiellia bacterium]|nr:DUF4162 domain-containing protein [Kiritimatiellia bacterium]
MDRGRIVVSGGIEEIARKIKGGRVFAVGVKGEARNARMALERFPGVRVTQEEGGELLVEIADVGFDETELVQALVQTGVRVTQFCERRHGIEDVFLMVSGPGTETAKGCGEGKP